MPTVCIHCSLRALVAGEAPPVFDETPEAHQQRAHPDLAATAAERRELERQLAARLADPPNPDPPNPDPPAR